MQFKCPNCGEAFALSVMVVPKTEAHGARRHKALADALDAMVLQAIADNPGRFMASGRHGLWENRFKLREELRVIGRDTMQRSVKRLLVGMKIIKDAGNTLRPVS